MEAARAARASGFPGIILHAANTTEQTMCARPVAEVLPGYFDAGAMLACKHCASALRALPHEKRR